MEGSERFSVAFAGDVMVVKEHYIYETFEDIASSALQAAQRALEASQGTKETEEVTK